MGNKTSSLTDLVKFSLTNYMVKSSVITKLVITMRPELVRKLWGDHVTGWHANFKLLEGNTLFLYPHVNGSLKFTAPKGRSANYRATIRSDLVSSYLKNKKMQAHTGTHVNFESRDGIYGIMVMLPEAFLKPLPEEEVEVPRTFDLDEDVMLRLIDEVEDGMRRLFLDYGILVHGRVKFEDAGDPNKAWFEPMGLGKPSLTVKRVGTYAGVKPAARVVPVGD